MYAIDFKNLVENLKKGLETIASPVISFNLADVKNKDYCFIIDNYLIKAEEPNNMVRVGVVGKVLKPCNLKGDEVESGAFCFGLSKNQVKTELAELNFENKIEILHDVARNNYGFGVMQVINFTGLVYAKIITDEDIKDGVVAEVHASIIEESTNQKEDIIIKNQL